MNSLRFILTAISACTLSGLACAQSQLIVQLAPGADPAAVATRDGVTLLDTTPNAPFALFGVPSGTSPDTAQQKLQADSAVVWTQGNNGFATASIGTSPMMTAPSKGSSLSTIGDRGETQSINSRPLDQVNWSSALANAPGRAVRLAILDTGLARSQSALWSKVDASLDMVNLGGNVDDGPTGVDSNGNGSPDDAVGHGTMVAGVADQVAPNVRLVVVRVADSDGEANAWAVVRGLAFAVANGAEVANLSLASTVPVAAISNLVDWCESKGLLIVAGSGNGAAANAYYPAKLDKVLCVAGLDQDDVKASFSNWDSICTSSAPGTGIVSQWWDGSMGVWSGTSFSSPFVAAAVADCLRRTTQQTPQAILRAVKASGRDLNYKNPNYSGKLGNLLDIASLDTAMHSVHP